MELLKLRCFFCGLVYMSRDMCEYANFFMLQGRVSQLEGELAQSRIREKELIQRVRLASLFLLYSKLVWHEYSLKHFTTQYRLLKTPQKRALENTVRKGENGSNQHFLLFPQCFLLYQREKSSF